ncbi:RNA 2'-phosphotransferase [Pseudomonas sp. RIT-To-2]|uniref:RNA 2'-phosphotransferase n=1 Tax=Pseudomonas sp. RIT-To-2 TaxID=3462541 RepID=UPI002413A5DC
MTSKPLNDLSKFLSYVLRHEPHTIGLTLDSEGWADLDQLITGAASQGRTLDRDLIRTVVDSSDKKRFALSSNGQRIRAVQGHSTTSVNLQHQEQEPPALLYHGTATRFLDSIREQGLIAGARHHVHLAEDTATATAVGQRYGKPVVLRIETQAMRQQGFKFFRAENGVWLVDSVPARFLGLDNPL